MLLALSLADFSDDDGGRIFPSIFTLAKKTRQSERNVQYQLKRMVQSGFITLVDRNVGGRFKGKKYKSNEYRINIGFFAKGEIAAPLTEGCKTEILRVKTEECKGATVISPNPPYTHPLEPPPTIASVNQVQMMEEIVDLVEAAVWATYKNGGKICNEARFRSAVRKRILASANGPSYEDMLSLQAWRSAKDALLAKNFKSQVEEKPRLKIDPTAQVNGANFFSNEKIKALLEKPKLAI